MEGVYKPGRQLSEELISKELDVSRNTLREAFRLLGHERLLEHRRNRGVFVTRLTVQDLEDLYRVRRVIEGAAIRRPMTAEAMAAMRKAVTDGERAAAAGDWQATGTANMRFHQALVTLNGSPRLDESMRQLLAELRLVFHVMENPRELHEPFVSRNRDLIDLMAEDPGGAAASLEKYFDDAEQLLIHAYDPDR
ncbi:MAG: GntR family transcriptional regulator [Nonomuraea sp.]|nr:GntR family transcriptional regulator [Nonomuraea sp.]